METSVQGVANSNTEGPVTLLLASLLAAAPAYALDYRTVELADGRTFVAEVTAELEDGLRLTVPPGVIEVKHAQVINMAPSDSDAYLVQGDWPVYVANGPDRKRIQEACRTMGGVALIDGSDTSPNVLSNDQLIAAEACGTDLNCLVRETEEAAWFWLITSEKRDSKTVGVKGRLNTQHIAFIGSYDKRRSEQVNEAIAGAIGVVPVP